MLIVWSERSRQFFGTRRDKSPGEVILQVLPAAISSGLLMLLLFATVGGLWFAGSIPKPDGLFRIELVLSFSF
ncbi:hypothetical protein IXB28_15100 [Leptothoe kymatousa TAU-MAC 1615]|uniref:ABC transporter permease n=1 Tax=Leptothoe kymatousa TAU-MAC 1615 TaxID=2364775 RepID=A0ABS5Y9B7_9CYAN|nr:hypothetical protein [Leptothoe kymatousa TAU-MAC 1615]